MSEAEKRGAAMLVHGVALLVLAAVTAWVHLTQQTQLTHFHN
jgi:hypothetical protein